MVKIHPQYPDLEALNVTAAADALLRPEPEEEEDEEDDRKEEDDENEDDDNEGGYSE